MLFTHTLFKFQKMLTYEPLIFWKKRNYSVYMYIDVREFIQQKKNKWLISKNWYIIFLWFISYIVNHEFLHHTYIYIYKSYQCEYTTLTHCVCTRACFRAWWCAVYTRASSRETSASYRASNISVRVMCISTLVKLKNIWYL